MSCWALDPRNNQEASMSAASRKQILYPYEAEGDVVDQI